MVMISGLRCFYAPLNQIFGNHVRISGRELHHLVNVVRLRKGDEITVLDGVGGAYKVVLESCGQDIAVGEIKNRYQAQPSLIEVTLFVGLPKINKMDMIVQKATELGAYQVVPILCQYTVPRLSAERTQQRVARWRQIAIEASKQSRRQFFPVISDILNFDEALKLSLQSQVDLKLILVAPLPLAARQHSITPNRLKDVLKQNAEARKVDIFIGPEGGFAENEVERALSAGAKSVSLGNNILRTETAAIAALSIVLYEKGIE
jgi:16S rRNA (uracil1498-N3)-methyltransferase